MDCQVIPPNGSFVWPGLISKDCWVDTHRFKKPIHLETYMQMCVTDMMVAFSLAFSQSNTKPQHQHQLLENILRPSSNQDPCQEVCFIGSFKIALNGNFVLKIQMV